VLVPDRVAQRHIVGAYVANETAAAALAAIVPEGFSIIVKPDLFFA
jgi:hypothetical protein